MPWIDTCIHDKSLISGAWLVERTIGAQHQYDLVNSRGEDRIILIGYIAIRTNIEHMHRTLTINSRRIMGDCVNDVMGLVMSGGSMWVASCQPGHQCLCGMIMVECQSVYNES